MCNRVVHCKKSKFDVYIGRPNKWGNPFVIGKDGTREDVIRKYREFLLGNDALLESLPELFGKIVACWCAPQGCHGDILVEFADKLHAYLEATGKKSIEADEIRKVLQGS
jgi:hypothetical protein